MRRPLTLLTPWSNSTLLYTYKHCLTSRQYVNVVVAGKQPAQNFLTIDQALAHCEHGEDIPEVRDWVWSDALAVNADLAVDATVATGGDNE